MYKTIVFTLVFFISALSVPRPASAALPVIVAAVARQAVTATASSVTFGIIARGFAANDPYIRTTATLPRSAVARRLGEMRGSRWSGASYLGKALALATGLAIFWDDLRGWLYTPASNPLFEGFCKWPSGGWGDSTLGNCLDVWNNHFASVGSSTTVSVSHYSGPNQWGRTEWYFAWSSGGTDYAFYSNNGSPPEPEPQPIPQSAYDKVLTDSIGNPDAWANYLSGLDQSRLNKILDGADIPDYVAGNTTPEFAALKDLYRQGLLQHTDPDAPYYVDKATYDKVKASVDADDYASSDEGKLDELNSWLKQPITQAQFEESNQLFSAETDTVTASVNNTDKVGELSSAYDELDNTVKTIGDSTLPDLPGISAPQYSSCRSMTIEFYGASVVIPNASQCEKIEAMKAAIGYLLWFVVATSLIWQLLQRPEG